METSLRASAATMATSMRAAVYKKAGERMAIKTVPIPTIRDDEILVKMVAGTLCGSDLVCYKGWHGPQTEGLVGGHEGTGIVAQVGASAASKFAAGDRVGFVNTMRNCGHCKPCLDGEGQFCESSKLNQGFDHHGFLAEYAVASAQFAVKVPDSLPLDHMSPLFCAGLTAFRALKCIDPPQRGLLGVYGLGGVGAFAVRFGTALGFRVVGFDTSPAARTAATAAGAVANIDSNMPDAASAAVQELTGGDGLDAALVCAGVPAAYEAAIAHAGFGSTIVTVGIPHSDIPVSIYAMVKKRLRLQGTQSGNPADMRQMMDLVTALNIVPELEQHGLDDVPDLMESLSQGKAMGKLGIIL